MPIFWSFLLIVLPITLFSVGGTFLMKPFVSKWWQGHDNNDQISFYLSAIGVFYGIMLGLLAAGVWQNYEEAEADVVLESSAIGALYRDVSAFPEPKRTVLQKKLAHYIDNIIHVSWPLHLKGITKTNGTALLTDFHQELYLFDPKTKREEIVFDEALRQFNKLAELRRIRLSSVTQGMPFVIWLMILIGVGITIILCWLFNIPSMRLHLVLNTLTGLAIGTLIYLILMLDYPFRGALAIKPDAYQEVYDHLIK